MWWLCPAHLRQVAPALPEYPPQSEEGALHHMAMEDVEKRLIGIIYSLVINSTLSSRALTEILPQAKKSIIYLLCYDLV
jgi:hypothetical protein